MDFAQLQHWFLNISDRQKQIALSIASVLAGAAILIAYFQVGPSALKYAEASSTFSKWSASPADETLYKDLKEAMHNIPALKKKYEAAIAQKLIYANKLDEGLVMANQSIRRVKNETPLHASFAMTSLLIEQGNFQEALEKAVALKEQMGTSFLNPKKGGSLLYLHNLLRIACLQQELNNRPGEKAAWEELEQQLQTKNRPVQILLGSFTEASIDLTQYIAERKKNLP